MGQGTGAAVTGSVFLEKKGKEENWGAVVDRAVPKEAGEAEEGAVFSRNGKGEGWGIGNAGAAFGRPGGGRGEGKRRRGRICPKGQWGRTVRFRGGEGAAPVGKGRKPLPMERDMKKPKSFCFPDS